MWCRCFYSPPTWCCGVSAGAAWWSMSGGGGILRDAAGAAVLCGVLGRGGYGAGWLFLVCLAAGGAWFRSLVMLERASAYW